MVTYFGVNFTTDEAAAGSIERINLQPHDNDENLVDLTLTTLIDQCYGMISTFDLTLENLQVWPHSRSELVVFQTEENFTQTFNVSYDCRKHENYTLSFNTTWFADAHNLRLMVKFHVRCADKNLQVTAATAVGSGITFTADYNGYGIVKKTAIPWSIWILLAIVTSTLLLLALLLVGCKCSAVLRNQVRMNFAYYFEIIFQPTLSGLNVYAVRSHSK